MRHAVVPDAPERLRKDLHHQYLPTTERGGSGQSAGVSPWGASFGEDKDVRLAHRPIASAFSNAARPADHVPVASEVQGPGPPLPPDFRRLAALQGMETKRRAARASLRSMRVALSRGHEESLWRVMTTWKLEGLEPAATRRAMAQRQALLPNAVRGRWPRLSVPPCPASTTTLRV